MSYFVTTKCWQSRTVFQVPETADTLIAAMLQYRDSGAYFLHEFVVMPNHLHLLLTPGPATSLERAMQLIKGGSSHRIRTFRNHKMQIWQEGFFEWTIRDADDWRIKSDYIRMNPVSANLVDRARDWKYSSASDRFVLDATPEKYLRLVSGAKAPLGVDFTRGLKPPPPKEKCAAQLKVPLHGKPATVPRSREDNSTAKLSGVRSNERRA